MTGASTFGDASKALETIGNAGLAQLDENSGLGLLSHMMIPAIVLKAFSCELLLKTLCVNAGICYGKEHSLYKLFEKLNTADIDAIRKSVCIKCSLSKDKFSCKLQKIGNTFIDWRYFFEDYRSLDIQFFNSFYEAVVKETKEYL